MFVQSLLSGRAYFRRAGGGGGGLLVGLNCVGLIGLVIDYASGSIRKFQDSSSTRF